MNTWLTTSIVCSLVRPSSLETTAAEASLTSKTLQVLHQLVIRPAHIAGTKT